METVGVRDLAKRASAVLVVAPRPGAATCDLVEPAQPFSGAP